MASRVLRSFLDVFASSERTVPSDHSPNVAAGGCCTTGRLRPGVEHGQLVHRRPLRAPRKASSASIKCRSREPQPDGSNVGAGGPDRPRLARSFGQGVARTSPRVLTVTTAPSLTMTHPASRLRLANSIVAPRQHLPPSRLSSGIRGRVTHPAPGEGQLVARLHEIAPGRSRRPRHSTPRTSPRQNAPSLAKAPGQAPRRPHPIGSDQDRRPTENRAKPAPRSRPSLGVRRVGETPPRRTLTRCAPRALRSGDRWPHLQGLTVCCPEGGFSWSLLSRHPLVV